jgi:hypothetical protein
LAGRPYGIPRSGWTDSPAARIRSDFVDLAFCVGPASRVRQADTWYPLVSAGQS